MLTTTHSQLRIFSLVSLFGLLVGAVVAFEWLPTSMATDWPPAIRHALRDGLLCALGTALGALPVLFIRSISQRTEDLMMGFGGGVMLAATVFSLLTPAIGAAQEQGYGDWSASLLTATGVVLGMVGLLCYDRILPNASPAPRSVSERGVLDRSVILFVTAIVLHNIPEGMAVGVATGGGLQGSDSLALGIALQDAPEGMIVALVLFGAGVSRSKAVLIGAASGLVEPVFAVICAWLVGVSTVVLPWGLSLAAGAMLFAVIHEIIPRSQRNGHDMVASLGLVAGFCLMMVLDTALA
ncbi:ZIP family metal transporter [Pseudomonas matsuisoli]|uniref:ZIP family metal transporter n=1 Tax=Pseudomonas matsuisoli TaxID=1515666 RepID=A0A917Q2Q8_9PSED|nr:ZIP family metal transporter [Pseudomonas matsuisoli]